jgi:hypothetical protein
VSNGNGNAMATQNITLSSVCATKCREVHQLAAYDFTLTRIGQVLFRQGASRKLRSFAEVAFQ